MATTKHPRADLAPPSDRPLTATEASEFLQVSVQSLANMRVRKQGPLFHKLKGVGVRYWLADLQAYVAASRVKRVLTLPAPRPKVAAE